MHLRDYLQSGPSTDEFLEGFPPITHEQARRVLTLAFDLLLEGLEQR